jgi:uncharacterized protein (TIGR02266 family)
MSRTAGVHPTPSEPQDAAGSHSVSGTHFRNFPVAESTWPVNGEPRIDQPAPAHCSEATELSQLRSLLEEREREVAGLKARIAGLEADLPEYRIKTLPPPSTATRAVNFEGRIPERCEAPHADTVSLDLPLQRVAVTYRANSVPPTLGTPTTRQSERQRCEIQIEFTEDTHFYAGLTQDISEGGVFIATYHLRPVGMRIDLSFVLPDGVEVQATGIVRWLRDGTTDGLRPGMGVGFTNLKPESLESINKYCRARAPIYMDI